MIHVNLQESVNEVTMTVKAHRGNHLVETGRRGEVMIHNLKEIRNETMIGIDAEKETGSAGEDEPSSNSLV